MVATGICGSDWHAWAGHDEIDFPHVPGHELAGVVAEVGEEVARWRVGDRVDGPVRLRLRSVRVVPGR